MKMMLKKIIPWTLNKQSESSKMKKKSQFLKKYIYFLKEIIAKGEILHLKSALMSTKRRKKEIVKLAMQRKQHMVLIMTS